MMNLLNILPWFILIESYKINGIKQRDSQHRPLKCAGIRKYGKGCSKLAVREVRKEDEGIPFQPERGPHGRSEEEAEGARNKVFGDLSINYANENPAGEHKQRSRSPACGVGALLDEDKNPERQGNQLQAHR